jgi:hypothetical protein
MKSITGPEKDVGCPGVFGSVIPFDVGGWVTTRLFVRWLREEKLPGRLALLRPRPQVTNPIEWKYLFERVAEV